MDEFSQDLTVYENVVAMIETSGQPAQVPVGTLIQTPGGWRVVDLALARGLNAAPEFVFFEPTNHVSQVGVSEKTEQLIKRLGKIDEALSTATRLK